KNLAAQEPAAALEEKPETVQYVPVAAPVSINAIEACGKTAVALGYDYRSTKKTSFKSEASREKWCKEFEKTNKNKHDGSFDYFELLKGDTQNSVDVRKYVLECTDDTRWAKSEDTASEVLKTVNPGALRAYTDCLATARSGMAVNLYRMSQKSFQIEVQTVYPRTIAGLAALPK